MTLAGYAANSRHVDTVLLCQNDEHMSDEHAAARIRRLDNSHGIHDIDRAVSIYQVHSRRQIGERKGFVPNIDHVLLSGFNASCKHLTG